MKLSRTFAIVMLSGALPAASVWAQQDLGNAANDSVQAASGDQAQTTDSPDNTDLPDRGPAPHPGPGPGHGPHPGPGPGHGPHPGPGPGHGPHPGPGPGHGPHPGPGPGHGIHHDPYPIHHGGDPWPQWNHPPFHRPVYVWQWDHLTAVTCTAQDSMGDEYPVTEDGYTDIEYQSILDQVEDAALNRCYDESGGDQGCFLVGCDPVY